MNYKSLVVISLIVALLSGCGGSSSSDGDSQTAPVNVDRFDLDAYSNVSVDAPGLTGTWLYVAKEDHDYRLSFQDESEYRRVRKDVRFIVSIIETESGFVGYSGLSEVDDIEYFSIGYNEETGEVYSLELTSVCGFAGFIGQITSNSRIEGATISLNDEDREGDFLAINASIAGLVKLSSEPRLPGRANIGSMRLSSGSSEQIDKPIHFFTEENFTLDFYEDDELVATNIVERLDFFHQFVEVDAAGISADRMTLSNFIQLENNFDDDPIGWWFEADWRDPQIRVDIRGIEDSLVQVRTLERIQGSYQLPVNEQNDGETFSYSIDLSGLSGE